MKKRVINAKLHDLNVVVPTVGAINVTSLPPQNKTFKSFNMFHNIETSMLEVEVNGIDVGIPLTNVQVMIYAKE